MEDSYQLFIQKWDTNNLEEWQEYTLHSLEDKINNQVPYAGINDFSIFFRILDMYIIFC